MANKTHPVEYGVAALGAPSKRWYEDRLRKGILPGRKVGKSWRLTDQDISDAIEILKNDSHIADAPSGLTPRSQQRAIG